MEKQIQYFQIANLIFTTPYNAITVLDGAEMSEIQYRFQSIVKSFVGTDNTQYATNYIKHGGSNLPYNSMTVIGEINNHIVLHFTFSYKEPVLFVIDTSEKKVKNYIDIDSAKGILDDEVYQDIKDELSYPKKLDRLFKGINDINEFVDKYETLLKEHDDPDAITGRECFEVDLDDR